MRAPAPILNRAHRLRLIGRRLGVRIRWRDILERGIIPIESECRVECERRGFVWERLEIEALRGAGKPVSAPMPKGMRWHKATGFVDDDGM